MNAGQYEGIVGRLDAILAKMPAAPVYEPEKTWPRVGSTVDQKTGMVRALDTMLRVLDGWIGSAQENHDAMGHRGENRGDECWRSFAPSDIRRMVNDAARELGLPEFPTPDPAQEDTTEGRVVTSPS